MSERDPNEFEQVEHQPASRHEISRHPPGGPECSRIRGLLRDYVDGDLDRDVATDVDDHVHHCRDCGLALSRAELEVLRLRKAFEQDAAEAAILPAGLTRRIRAELEPEDVLSEESIVGAVFAGKVPGQRSHGPSEDFTRAVMERVNREWRKPTFAERVRVRRWIGVAAVALIGFGIAWTQFDAVEDVPRARVAKSSGAVGVLTADGAERPADVGFALFDGAVIVAGPGAEFELVLTDGGPGMEASRVQFEGAARVAFHADAIGLELGDCRIETAQELRFTGLADASALVQRGRFDLRVAQRQRFDGALSARALTSVRLEVLAGRATIDRRGVPTDIASGHVAHFGDWRALEIEPGMTQDLLDQSGGYIARVSAVSSQRMWRGRIVEDRTGLGVVAAQVRFEFGGEWSTCETDPRGFFELPARDLDLCLVTVDPPSDSKLNRVATRPIPVPARGGAIETVRLSAQQPFWGSVRDRAGQPVAAVKVTPFVVDDIFGMCEVHKDLAATSDADGRFELPSLPRDLAPQQRVALVFEHRDNPTTAVGGLLADRDHGREFRLDAPRALHLVGLPATCRVEIVQGVPGLSLGAFAVRSEVTTDANGSATLVGAGSGRIWFHDRANREGVPMLAAVIDGVDVYRGDRDSGSKPRFDDLNSGFSRNQVRRSGNRFAALRALPQQPTGFLTLLGRDSIVVPKTRIYLVRGSGSHEFLGEYAGDRTFPFVAPDGPYSIVAIGPDGSVGWRRGADLAEGHETISMSPPGGIQFDVPQSAELEAPGSAAVVLLFRMLDGVLPGAEFWRPVSIDGRVRVENLLPGNYVIEFDEATRLRVAVEAGGFVNVGLPEGAQLAPK